MTAAENVVDAMTAQLLKKEAELTNLRRRLQQAEMDGARLLGVLTETRKELKRANDRIEEMLGLREEDDATALEPREVYGAGR